MGANIMGGTFTIARLLSWVPRSQLHNSHGCHTSWVPPFVISPNSVDVNIEVEVDETATLSQNVIELKTSKENYDEHHRDRP
jgi:hypothetical protein